MSNKTTTDGAFLTNKKIYRNLWSVYLSIFLLICLILIPDKSIAAGLGLMVLIFGGLNAISELQKFSQSQTNIEYLKNNNYYEKMCLETPAGFSGLLHFTETFVFNPKRLLCLPVEHIRTVRPIVVNYINSAGKSKIQLDIVMDNGDEYCLLLKQGSVTESRKHMLITYIDNLYKMNPKITIQR